MNASLPPGRPQGRPASPRLSSSRPRVAVIGAGPGGLAAAMLLATSGARVTLHERDGVVGGRTRTLAAPAPGTTGGEYRFDLGPTFFLYPRILSEIFAACGARLEEEVELVRLDPQYRLVFEGGGTIDATPDLARMEAEIARLCPGDAQGLRPFMAENAAKLEAFRPVLERAFGSPTCCARCGCCGRTGRWTPTWRATSATRACASPSPSSRNTSG
jgi:phytoene desaturase